MKKYMQRTLACLALCAVLTGILAPSASAAGFQDVPADHWAAGSIQRCVEQGFFKGQSESWFGLGQQMTRGAFAVVLCRFFGWETEAVEQSTFRDVAADAWYAGAVEAAYAHGAVTMQREVFRPDEPITREELAVMLVRALGYSEIAGLAQDMPFQDVTSNAGYIAMAYHLGLVNGTSATTFAPDKTAPREQVAVMLMRVYDRLRGTAPETCAIVSAPADFTGLDAAAIPAGQLTLSDGKAVLTTGTLEAADALREAAQSAGVKALLYVEGFSFALGGETADLAAVLTAAVQDGGYDGLLLDFPKLGAEKKTALTQLAQALDAALADKLFYLMAEAPLREGKPYSGYDYAALGAAADRLVLRMAAQAKIVNDMPIAPLEPLEEIYYALASLREKVAAEKISLLLTTTPSAWSDGKRREMSSVELEKLLTSARNKIYYSDRYAAAYFVGTESTGKNLVVWYLDGQGAAAKAQLAQCFGVGQLCLSDWNAASAEVQAALR